MAIRVFAVLGLCLVYVTGQKPCPDGFEHHATSCYLFSHDSETWVNAMELCSEMFHGDLVKIETSAEGQYIATRAASKNVTYWLGINDIVTEARWVWGSDVDAVVTAGGSYTNWAPGEPNNKESNENCAVLNQLGYWYDIPCLYPVPYICEVPAAHP